MRVFSDPDQSPDLLTSCAACPFSICTEMLPLKSHVEVDGGWATKGWTLEPTYLGVCISRVPWGRWCPEIVCLVTSSLHIGSVRSRLLKQARSFILERLSNSSAGTDLIVLSAILQAGLGYRERWAVWAAIEVAQ